MKTKSGANTVYILSSWMCPENIKTFMRLCLTPSCFATVLLQLA